MEAAVIERRRDPRTICSVMSEVLVVIPNGSPRYLAPAIVTDISASGLALEMDLPPPEYGRLVVRNTYFHAEVIARNAVPQQGGFRIGCEFVRRLEWQPDRNNALGATRTI